MPGRRSACRGFWAAARAARRDPQPHAAGAPGAHGARPRRSRRAGPIRSLPRRPGHPRPTPRRRGPAWACVDARAPRRTHAASRDVRRRPGSWRGPGGGWKPVLEREVPRRRLRRLGRGRGPAPPPAMGAGP